MKPPITYSSYIVLYNFARDLALALADEAMYIESMSRDGTSDPPSDNTTGLLSRAHDELELAKPFDELDSLKPIFERIKT